MQNCVVKVTKPSRESVSKSQDCRSKFIMVMRTWAPDTTGRKGSTDHDVGRVLESVTFRLVWATWWDTSQQQIGTTHTTYRYYTTHKHTKLHKPRKKGRVKKYINIAQLQNFNSKKDHGPVQIHQEKLVLITLSGKSVKNHKEDQDQKAKQWCHIPFIQALGKQKW